MTIKKTVVYSDAKRLGTDEHQDVGLGRGQNENCSRFMHPIFHKTSRELRLTPDRKSIRCSCNTQAFHHEELMAPMRIWHCWFHLNVASARSCLANIVRSEEHTSELQSRQYLVCRLLLEKKQLT